MSDAVLTVYDYFPKRGPCAFCERYDQTHRIVDAIAEQVRAGDPVTGIAMDYDTSPEGVQAAAAADPEAYRLVEEETDE